MSELRLTVEEWLKKWKQEARERWLKSLSRSKYEPHQGKREMQRRAKHGAAEG